MLASAGLAYGSDHASVDDLERALLDVLVGAMDRVPGLESDHRLPAAPGELGARLGRREAVLDEVVVCRQPQYTKLARRAEVSGLVQGLHTGVTEIPRAEDRVGLALAVAPEQTRHLQDGDRLAALLRNERDGVGSADPLRLLVGERQGDGDRPGQPGRKVHRLQDRGVVALALEPGER